MNTNKREEKKCGEACLSHYGPVALYQYEKGDKTFWLCNAALFEELRRGEKVMPALPQNGDREKEEYYGARHYHKTKEEFEACQANCENLILGKPSPSEGKENLIIGNFGAMMCFDDTHIFRAVADKCNCGKTNRPSEGKEVITLKQQKFTPDLWTATNGRLHIGGNASPEEALKALLKLDSEGKEKEPKQYTCRFHPTDGFHEIGCPHREWTDEELIQDHKTHWKHPKCPKCNPALAEKETAPKTDWEERWDDEFEELGWHLPANVMNDIKDFIQTLLNEKNEEFVKELKPLYDSMIETYQEKEMKYLKDDIVFLGDAIRKYSPEGNKETTKE